MTNKPKAIGTAGETAVVRYLVANGFGGAERTALHGSADEGDITGTPGLGWEVKAGHVAEAATDGSVATWLAEAECERRNRGADVCVLITKRKGRGAQRAGEWWAWLPGWAFYNLAAAAFSTGRLYLPSLTPGSNLPPIRCTLAEVVTMLRRAGYGDPIEASA